MRWVKIVIFLSILLIFIYLRITPILNQTVPYTYDQGRDFLKAEEIVRFRNPTFIGPTTGIQGLYHGAWWYYLLSIPYFLFNGHPLSFYYFIFFISVVGNLIFFIFLKKEFNFNTALLFFTIVSVSPYFISLSFFVSNNIIAPYFILLLIVSIYYLFKTKKYIWLFYISLSLGFIHEFEVAFGLFIFLLLFILLLVYKNSRKIIFSLKGVAYFTLGLIIPFIPRVLFEIKHNFLQTKTFLNFFLKPKFHNPKLFSDIFNDRLSLFLNYFRGIFIDYHIILSITGLIMVIFVFIKFWKKVVKSSFLTIFSLLSLLLFLASLLYKDNFWANYYEGIPYIFLFVITISFYFFSKHYQKFSLVFLTIYFLLSLAVFIRELNNKNQPLKDFKAIDKAVLYIYSQVKEKDFCVKIYTPPVIPYTYDYLFSYYSRIKNINRPTTNYLNNRCWFIIENDPYHFRFKDWAAKNIPENGKKISSYQINKDITIQLWKK